MQLKKSVLKLGTRRSLLAWAQSSWVAREIERTTPGVTVELVGIDTRGDRILDVSLRNIEGKEFFVAELDQALRSGEVDFTVHSLKDLSLERPADFVCGAIPKRENPRDVVLFGPTTLSHLREGKTLKIGTSSPRRIENIPSFLSRALPRLGGVDQKKSELEFVEIRGNVNTRLSRVHESESSPKYLDGVVLAFAGLIRLWADAAGRAELQKLLKGVRWMVLPLKECPAAPGQGALAVECRAGDSYLRELLAKIHHPETQAQVHSERQLLEAWGGGCHQRFGATSIKASEMGDLLFIRGAKSNGEEVNELRWNAPTQQNTAKQLSKPWESSSSKNEEVTRLPVNSVELNQSSALFVAHSRAAEGLDLSDSSRVWTSGAASWMKLAEKGIWVEGCAESFGFDFLQPLLQEGVLELPELKEWTVLTHSEASKEWASKNMKVIPTYRINCNYGNDSKTMLNEATHAFWSSGSQFDEIKETIPRIREIHHSCGSGKTAARLREFGLNPVMFPSIEEWRKWLNLNQ